MVCISCVVLLSISWSLLPTSDPHVRFLLTSWAPPLNLILRPEGLPAFGGIEVLEEGYVESLKEQLFKRQEWQSSRTSKTERLDVVLFVLESIP